LENFVWTDTVITDLKSLTTEGFSAGAIAGKLSEKYGVLLSRNAILGKCHRLGIRRERPTRPVAVPKTITSKPKASPKLSPHPFVPRVVELASLNLPFVEWRRGQCMFACGNDEDGGHLFCGHPVAAEKPYCAHHCAIAYYSPQAWRDERIMKSFAAA
jgi:GcrA cell cycle regulator